MIVQFSQNHLLQVLARDVKYVDRDLHREKSLGGLLAQRQFQYLDLQQQFHEAQRESFRVAYGEETHELRPSGHRCLPDL